MIPAYVVAGPSPPTRAPSQGTEFLRRKGKHSKTRAWNPQFSIKKKKERKKKDVMGLYAALLQYTTKELGKTCKTTDSDSGTSNAGP